MSITLFDTMLTALLTVPKDESIRFPVPVGSVSNPNQPISTTLEPDSQCKLDLASRRVQPRDRSKTTARTVRIRIAKLVLFKKVNASI